MLKIIAEDFIKVEAIEIADHGYLIFLYRDTYLIAAKSVIVVAY